MSKNDSMSQAMASAVPVTLKGHKVRVRPISLGDLADFEAWAKARQLDEFRKATEGMDDSRRMTTIADMTRQAISEEIIAQSMQTIGGVRFLLTLILRGENGELIEDMDALVDMNNLQEVSAIIHGISGLEADDSHPTEAAASSD